MPEKKENVTSFYKPSDASSLVEHVQTSGLISLVLKSQNNVKIKCNQWRFRPNKSNMW